MNIHQSEKKSEKSEKSEIQKKDSNTHKKRTTLSEFESLQKK